MPGKFPARCREMPFGLLPPSTITIHPVQHKVYSLTVEGYIDDVPEMTGQQVTGKPTNDKTPTLIGKVQGADTLDTVLVLENGVQIAVATVDRVTGIWQAENPATSDGLHNYTVEVHNGLGIVKATATAALTVDTEPPAGLTNSAIYVTDEGTSSETVLSGKGERTSDNTPRLKGSAEP